MRSVKTWPRIRPAGKEDLPRVLELARMWPENFVQASFRAIEEDFRSFQCVVCEDDEGIQGFVIFVVSYYEVEHLWAASNRERRERSEYLALLARHIEEKFYTNCPHRRVIFARIAAPDATIEGEPEFKGSDSRPVSLLLAKLGYNKKYRMESFWFPGDHFLIVAKQKHNGPQ